MRKTIHGINALLSLLIIFVLAIPVIITGTLLTPVEATCSNITINSPGVSPNQAYTKANGIFSVDYTLGLSGGSPTSAVEIHWILYTGTVPNVFSIQNTVVSSVNITGLYTNTSYLTMPANITDGTYGLRMDVVYPQSGGTLLQGTPVYSCIVVNSSAIPTAPNQLTPASVSCSSGTAPVFTWTRTASIGDSYNFQLSTNSLFTALVALTGNTGLTSMTYTVAPALAAGQYYGQVQTQDKYGNLSAWSLPWTICIDTATNLTTPALSSPSGTVPAGYSPTYTWSASTENIPSSCAYIQYVVETFNTGTTTCVDNQTVSTTSYTRGSVLPSGTYDWKVTAFNCAWLHSSVSSVSTFTIPTSPGNYSIGLSPGWNLVSLPLIPDATLTWNIASRVDPPGSVWAIGSYDGCVSNPANYKYWILSPGIGYLDTVVDGKSYWIYATAQCRLYGTGRPCPAAPGTGAVPAPYQYSLSCVGDWNMLGFKCNQNMQASNYLQEISGTPIKYDSLLRYAGGWVPVGASDPMTPGTGYYIKMNTAGKITPPCY